MAVILQMCWFDSGRDVRKYPAVLQGISERLHGPCVEYVFLDTSEQVQELRERISKHIPAGHEPHVSTLPAGRITARDAWTAMISASVGEPSRDHPFD